MSPLPAVKPPPWMKTTTGWSRSAGSVVCGPPGRQRAPIPLRGAAVPHRGGPGGGRRDDRPPSRSTLGCNAGSLTAPSQALASPGRLSPGLSSIRLRPAGRACCSSQQRWPGGPGDRYLPAACTRSSTDSPRSCEQCS